MFLRLVLLFTLVPVVELYILIKLGTVIGAWQTLLVVIGTGVLGAALAKAEGLRAWLRIQEQLRMGVFPGDELLNGLLILVSGLLLLTPGLLTDITGFLLLVPQTRRLFKKWAASKLRRMMDSGHTGITYFMR